MAGIRVTERGGDFPAGAGVTDADGFPLTEGEYLKDNAWTVWRAARSRAIKEGAPAQGQVGTLGVTLFCRMAEIEQLIWPVMTTDEASPDYERSALAQDRLRTYLRVTDNMFEQESMGRGRAGSTWWVRAEWNGSPPKPQPVPAVTVTEPEPEPLRLDGRSFPADVMTCLNGRDRMHLSELLRMLPIGSPVYTGMTIRSLQDGLAVAGILTDSVSIGSATRLGVRRDAVQAGLDSEADAEAAAIVQKAHIVAEAAPVTYGAAADLRDAVTAILEENAALIADNDRLTAENRRLQQQPVSDELIEKALAGKNKEIEELTFRLRAVLGIRGMKI